MSKNLFITLLLTMAVIFTGCSSSGSPDLNETANTKIEGTLTIEGEPITNAKLIAGGNVGKVDNNGRYSMIIEPGDYTVQINTLLGTTQHSVSIVEDKSNTFNYDYSFTELGLSSIMETRNYFRDNLDSYIVPGGEKWETNSLFNIVKGAGGRWAPGVIQYSFNVISGSESVVNQYKSEAATFFNTIEDELNNIITFEPGGNDLIFTINDDGTGHLTNGHDGFTNIVEYDESTGLFSKVNIELSSNYFDHGVQHELGHALGLSGTNDAHLPAYDDSGKYLGQGELFYPIVYNYTPYTYSTETWNILKLIYSIEPIAAQNNTWSNIEVYYDPSLIP